MRQFPLVLDTERRARVKSGLQFAAATMAIWTLLALLSIAQTAIYLRGRGQDVPWDKLAFATVRNTLTHYFNDRARGEYRFHIGTIEPLTSAAQRKD